MTKAIRGISPHWAMALAATLTIVALWPGIDGPFILDDVANLLPLSDWRNGLIDGSDVLFGNHSSPLGRPLSMASFMLNSIISIDSAAPYKIGNLILHLLCGITLYSLLLHLARRDTLMGETAQPIALFIATLWLVHPMLVGTVFYVVQRMTILASLFVLLALVAYVVGRQHVDAGRRSSGYLLVLGLTPLLTALATLSKESGLLAILMCCVIEATYFRPAPNHSRHWLGRVFLIAPPGAAIILLVAIIAFQPSFLFGGYSSRTFTAGERLLTQGPVLVDYLRGTILPAGPNFSLFRDDYPISKGLFAPPSTAVSWFVLLALAGSAVLLRNRIPAFAAGVGIFFAGHLLESTVLPLMLYFEHRNYLPAAGILFALTGIVVHLIAKLRKQAPNAAWLISVGAMLLVASFAIAAHNRAWIWQSRSALLQQTLENFPDSRLARIEAAADALRGQPPRLDEAIRHFAHLKDLTPNDTRVAGYLGSIYSQCIATRSVDPLEMNTLSGRPLVHFEADVVMLAWLVGNLEIETPCEGFDRLAFADWIVQSLETDRVKRNSNRNWGLRYIAARMYELEGSDDTAVRLAREAWDDGATSSVVAEILVRLYLRNGQHEAAESIWLEAESRFRGLARRPLPSDLNPQRDRGGSDQEMDLDEHRRR